MKASAALEASRTRPSISRANSRGVWPGELWMPRLAQRASKRRNRIVAGEVDRRRRRHSSRRLINRATLGRRDILLHGQQFPVP